MSIPIILIFTIISIIKYISSFSDFKSCTANQYYDLSEFECKACPSNQIPTIDSKLNYLYLELSCECAMNAIEVFSSNSALSSFGNIAQTKTCSACPTGQVASRDKTTCLGCLNGISQVTGDCDCPVGSVIEEKDPNGDYYQQKICKECLGDTYPGLQKVPVYECTPCPYKKVYNKNTSPWRCECDVTKYSEHGGECFDNVEANFLNTRYSSASASAVSFLDSEIDQAEISISSSDPINYLYLKSGYKCLKDRDIKSCQTLANICVLHLYDLRKTPCDLFRYISQLKNPLPNKK